MGLMMHLRRDRVISQMVRTGQSITDFVDTLPVQHATPELHIDCADTEKFVFMERFQPMPKPNMSKKTLL